MFVYIVLLMLVAILGYLEYRYRLATMIDENGIIKKRQINIYLVLIAAVFLFVGGFRYQVGSDFGTYYAGYVTTWSEILFRFQTFDEPLIYLLTKVARMIWNEGFFVIFVENAITVLLVFKGIRDWEEESWTLPFLMYIMYCGWTGSFNGVRQALAAALIFAFSRKTGKYWILKYGIVCFIAFLMHKTAIFILPLLVLANRRIDWKQSIIISVVAVLMPYMGNYALSMVGSSLNTQYASHSVNIIRIMVSILPVVLIILTNESFRKTNSFLINMAVINAIITFTTRNSALMYRFSSYTNMYLMLYIPKLAAVFTKESKRIYYVLVFILFFIYFYTEIQSGNGNLNNFQWIFGMIGG